MCKGFAKELVLPFLLLSDNSGSKRFNCRVERM